MGGADTAVTCARAIINRSSQLLIKGIISCLSEINRSCSMSYILCVLDSVHVAIETHLTGAQQYQRTAFSSPVQKVSDDPACDFLCSHAKAIDFHRTPSDPLQWVSHTFSFTTSKVLCCIRNE